MRRTLKAISLAAALAACSHTASAPPTLQTAEHVERVQHTSAQRQSGRFRGLMSEHFGFSVWARDAVVIGDLAAARDALRLLADYAYTDVVPGAWLPRVRALQDDARDAARAESIGEVARGVARLGGACGSCHAATGGGPALHGAAPERYPPEHDSFPDRMFRHQRAMSALWAGLVAPSTAIWDEGAATLAAASAELDVETPLRQSLRDGLAQLQQLAERARLATNQVERADSYAALLVSCVSCHERAWSPIF
ncbi:MAG TPA: hypothetical protein VJR89_15960 [Polyangiales bacterium]|nr:hypothetical protein [Polyangiales bacterium]